MTIVRADEKLTVFAELESAVRACAGRIMGSCGDPEEAKNPSGGIVLRLIQIRLTYAVYTGIRRILYS